jgi:hypothetical protein
MNIWIALLPRVLLGLRAIPREEDGHTPAQAFLGLDRIFPAEFLTSSKQKIDISIEKFETSVRFAEGFMTRQDILPAISFPPTPELLEDLPTSRLAFVQQDGHLPMLLTLYANISFTAFF